METTDLEEMEIIKSLEKMEIMIKTHFRMPVGLRNSSKMFLLFSLNFMLQTRARYVKLSQCKNIRKSWTRYGGTSVYEATCLPGFAILDTCQNRQISVCEEHLDERHEQLVDLF